MNQSDLLLTPLSIEEFDELESFLVSESTPENCFSSIEMLDGYMTALVVGPEMPSVDVWMSNIWDQETSSEPVFSSETEERMIKEYLVRHMNTIALQFQADPDEYLPIHEKFSYPDEQQTEVAVEEWAIGFTMGMELEYEVWEPFFVDEETSALILPMFILGKISDDYDVLSEDETNQLIEMLPDIVV
ncbi:MAG: YecA family protein, partial [Chlorobiaceae bacterium]|nr:YecA family protein [Chlorobiaceae bacterium]